MPRKLLTHRWTEEDTLKLVKLFEDGATLSRAVAGAIEPGRGPKTLMSEPQGLATSI